MNIRYKALGLVLLFLIIFSVSCKKDDSVKVEPPRDYGVQYQAESDSIETYLNTHYIASVDADMNITFAKIDNGQTSIKDQTDYPLLYKMVNVSDSNSDNDVDYKVYYLVLREGVGESPTRADLITAPYRGTLFDGTQFDYNPYPSMSLLSGAIDGWQEIIPLFKTGTYVDTPDNPDPASYQDYGAGVMFLPSGLGYYNVSQTNIPAYSPLIFSFKLYNLEYIDTDGDGILSKDETVPGVDIKDYDTDGDGIPNYKDTDDDNDGYLTRDEITDGDGNLYSFDDIPACDGGTVKKHLDPDCH